MPVGTAQRIQPLGFEAELSAACSRLRPRARDVAAALAEVTFRGYVTNVRHGGRGGGSLAELGKRLARGAHYVREGVRDLIAAGLLVRRHLSSDEFKWSPAAMRRLASGSPNLRLVEDPDRVLWAQSYRAQRAKDRRYWKSQTPPGRPSADGWRALLDFGAQLCRETGASLPVVAALTCERFFRLRGRTAERGHPFVFLAGDLHELAPIVRRRLLRLVYSSTWTEPPAPTTNKREACRALLASLPQVTR